MFKKLLNKAKILFYDMFIEEYGHPIWIYNEERQKERIEWLKNNSYGKILEVGCATGYVLNYVNGHTGIDINENRLKVARKRYKHLRFICMNAIDIKLNEKFDTVIIPDVLEHVEFDAARDIIKGCKKIGNRLLITVPNAEKGNYDKNLVENPEHRWFPTRKKMEQLLGKSISIEYTKEKDFMLVKYIKK